MKILDQNTLLNTLLSTDVFPEPDSATICEKKLNML